MKFKLRSSARVALAALLALAAATHSPLHATNLTGTFKHPDGSPVNGKLIFLLSQPARLSDASAQIVPMVKIFSVTNGQLEAGAFVYGNDALLPSGTYYLVRLVDASNNLLFEQKWSIQGTNLDLGTLTPTTTGVVLPDPLLKNIPVDQSVEGPVTFNSPLTAFSLTLHGNLHPGLADTYDLGNNTLPWRELSVLRLIAKGTPWFDVKAFGAAGDGNTNDTAAFQAAATACATAGGGTVYVPPSSTEYLVPGPLTLTSPAGGWCTLLLAGDIALYDNTFANGSKITMQRRWAIKGASFSKIAGQGTAMYDPVASIRGHQTNGPDTTIEITGLPAVIEGIKITNVKQYGVNVIPAPGSGVSNFKMINSNIAKSTIVTGAALRIVDVQDVIVRDSSFNITNASGGDQSYAVEITQNAANLSLYTFDNVAVLGAGFLLQGQGGFEIGAMAFKSILYQNPVNKTALLQVVTKRNGSGVGVRGLTFVDVQAADPSGPAVNGVYLIENITTETGAEGIIEGVVIRNPAYFVKGFYKPSSAAGYTGCQEILGLSVHSTQEPSGSQPIGQFNRYSATNRLGFRTGQLNVEGGAKFVINMQRPTGVTATPFTSGGSLADGTYFYVVTALDADGNQTFISDEKSCAISGGGGSGRCDLSWSASPGAASYRIYGRGQALAYLNQQKPNYGTSSGTTFSDTGTLGNSGPPPDYKQDAGNAAAFKFVSNGASWINNGSNFGIGTSSPGAPLDVAGKIRTTTQLESTQATGTAPLVVASST
jgi:hypothetical protein